MNSTHPFASQRTRQTSRPPEPNSTAAAERAEAAFAAPEIHSEESERLVLGCMLSDARRGIHHELAALISDVDFFVETHRSIWQIIITLRESGKEGDAPAVIDFAATREVFVGGAAYVVELAGNRMATTVADETVMATARRVKEYSCSRGLQTILADGYKLAARGTAPEQVIALVEEDVANVRRNATTSQTGPKHVSHFIDANIARMMAVQDGEATGDIVATGIEDLDLMLQGGLPIGLVVLAGRPGMGKTALALAIESLIANRGVPTLMFSLEMSGVSLVQRKIARQGRIPLRGIKQADLTEHQYQVLTEAVTIMGNTKSYIDETPGLTLGELRARARAFKRLVESKHPEANGSFVIFVDYLQIVQLEESVSKSFRGEGMETKATGAISKGLTALANELKVPVVALAQLNRGVEQRTNKRPMMSDLRESGQIEQDASVILFAYRDEYYNPDTKEPGITELIGAKCRDSATGTVKLGHDLSTMSYFSTGFQGGEA